MSRPAFHLLCAAGCVVVLAGAASGSGEGVEKGIGEGTEGGAGQDGGTSPGPRLVGSGTRTEASPAAADAFSVAAVIAEADRLYRVRHVPASSAQAMKLLREAQERSPTSYELTWRLARALIWEAASTDDRKAQRELGEECLVRADEAVALKPKQAWGHFSRAICMGILMQAVSSVTTLRRGLDTKFRDALLRTLELDPDFEKGIAHQVLGRYHFEMPWPLRNVDESVRLYRRALELNPRDIRTRVWLAEALAAKGRRKHREEIHRLLREALDAPLGRYDLPEEMRAKALIPQVLSSLKIEWETGGPEAASAR